MSNATIQRAFEYLHDASAVSAFKPQDIRRMGEFFVPGNVPDARFKLTFGAATTDYRSAIVYYRGVKYHVTVSPSGEVTLMDGN